MLLYNLIMNLNYGCMQSYSIVKFILYSFQLANIKYIQPYDQQLPYLFLGLRKNEFITYMRSTVAEKGLSKDTFSPSKDYIGLCILILDEFHKHIQNIFEIGTCSAE